MMAAQGIELDRSTLAGWVGQASALLDPIVSRIREVGLSATKIHTDDTPVPMLDPGRGKTATGRLWAYVVDDRGSGATSPPLVWYHFTQDRTGTQIGRKNWLFAGSKAGGERAAAIYTVIETCKLNGVEPQAYIADVIAKIAGDWPASRWDELMPWNWRRANEQLIAKAA